MMIKQIFKMYLFIILQIFEDLFYLLGHIYLLVAFWDWNLKTLQYKQNLFLRVALKFLMWSIDIFYKNTENKNNSYK